MKTLKKQKLNFFHCTLFHMKTRVSLKYCRSTHGHKYTKYKMYLTIIRVICIKGTLKQI